MDQIIKIYNPLGSKFSKLSNRAKHIMEIKGEDWKSVDHYVFANLLKNPIYRLKLKNISTAEDELKLFKTQKYIDKFGKGPKVNPSMKEQTPLQIEYSKLYDQTFKDTLWEAYTNAYIQKFETFPDLSELLISTGDSKLLFRNSNTLIGIDDQGNGENIIGKVLENIRYRFKNAIKKTHKEQIQKDINAFIYKIYATGSIIKNLLYKGENIDRYNDMTYDDS